MRWRVFIFLACLTLASSIHYRAHHKYKFSGSLFTQFLYLPPAEYLRHICFGYENLFADMVYLWSIQYYGEPLFKPKMEFLEHTFNIITDLDPHFIDAYQTGALFLFYDARKPAAGLRLLEKGMNHNPEEWILPVDAGFYSMINIGDYEKAAYYFDRAAKIPDAPPIVVRMLAGMHFRMGEKRHALELWKQVYETESRPTIKQIAYQHMHDLKVLIDLEEIEKRIMAFRRDRGKNPVSLEQLVASGYFSELPLDPEGEVYLYNPRTGKVSYSKELRRYHRYDEQ